MNRLGPEFKYTFSPATCTVASATVLPSESFVLHSVPGMPVPTKWSLWAWVEEVRVC